MILLFILVFVNIAASVFGFQAPFPNVVVSFLDAHPFGALIQIVLTICPSIWIINKSRTAGRIFIKYWKNLEKIVEPLNFCFYGTILTVTFTGHAGVCAPVNIFIPVLSMRRTL
jgi:hypothetical protein